MIPLYEDRLRASGMLTRPTDRRGGIWDFNSNAAAATEFAIARFFVPLLAHSGWCLFADCDVLFVEDPHLLLDVVDDSKALMVVQHAPLLAFKAHKMDGQVQSWYPRKLWSSICMWNAGHPANRRLNLTTLNQWSGRDLHAFGWLSNDEIGALDPAWNHLVGINPPRNDAKIIHFTEGVPSMAGYEDCEHADLWRSARAAA